MNCKLCCVFRLAWGWWTDGHYKPSLKSVLEAIKALDTKIGKSEENLTGKINDIKKYVDDKVKGVHQELSGAVASAEEKIAKNSTDVKILQDQVQQLQGSLNKMQQYSRRNTLEIHGLPVDEGEDKAMQLEIIKDIGKHYDITIEEHHLDDYHRLPSLINNPLIVKFANRWVCNELKQRRKKKGITARDVGFDASDNKVYINVSLNREKGLIAKESRQFCKGKPVLARVDDAGNIWMVRQYPKESIKKYPVIKFEIRSVDDLQVIYNKIEEEFKKIAH